MKYYTQDVAASQTPIAPTPIVYRYDAGGLGQVVTFANVLITIVLIAGIYFDNKSATVAVLSGVAYFAFGTGITVLALSRTLTDVITNRQQQITVRELQRLQYYASQSVIADPMQIEYRPPMLAPVPLVALPQAPSYVSAVPPADERLKLSCYEFVNALFTDEGVPNPKRILGEKTKRPYQVQYSKPKADVLEYLHGLNMIWLEEDGMLFFDAEKYPTRRDAINAIQRGA